MTTKQKLARRKLSDEYRLSTCLPPFRSHIPGVASGVDHRLDLGAGLVLTGDPDDLDFALHHLVERLLTDLEPDTLTEASDVRSAKKGRGWERKLVRRTANHLLDFLRCSKS